MTESYSSSKGVEEEEEFGSHHQKLRMSECVNVPVETFETTDDVAQLLSTLAKLNRERGFQHLCPCPPSNQRDDSVVRVVLVENNTLERRFLDIRNNDELRTFKKDLSLLAPKPNVEVVFALESALAVPTEALEDLPPPLVRAQDDSSVERLAIAQNFDVNRSYTNDGRYGLLAPARSNQSLQSVPVCSSSVDRVQKKRSNTIWRFRKEMVIGAGADGKVYLAVDLQSDEHIALKEILISPSTNRTLLEAQEDSKKMGLMKRQIDMLQRLPPHPNIVQHLGAERTTCALNVMMEYIAGGSISALLSKLGSFNERVVRLYSKHICTGLAFLHHRGIVHRDIKGANCLIGVDGVAKVCDFGCCIISSLEGASTKGIHGTSMWMSPECIQSLQVTGKTDIWSLGCTIVEMATGKPPWYEAHFTNEWAAMFHISQSKRGPPIPQHLSRQAHDFLQKCFAINPDERPTAEECLAHPFLVEDYQPHSSNPDMHPPTPTEANAPFFPTGKRSETVDINEYSTSNYSTINGGAVYDQEWGDAETAIGDEDDSGEVVQGVAVFPTNPSPMSSDELKKSEVSLDVIDEFLRGEIQDKQSPASRSFSAPRTVPEPPRELDDEYGIGLPEPVLYNVFFFLDAKALCSLTATSKSLRDMVSHGAKEVLWKTLFVNVFGEVSNVQLTLRKNWKMYFKNSMLHRNIVVDDRYRVLRQLGQSENVYDGIDINTKEPVVIKIERWYTHSNGRRLTSQGANFHGTCTMMRTTSPTRLPAITRTPTKGKSGATSQHGRPPAPLFSPMKDRKQTEELPPPPPLLTTLAQHPHVTTSPQFPQNQIRPPLGRLGNVSPAKHRPNQVLPPAGPLPSLPPSGRGRMLPKNSRLHSPLQLANQSTTTTPTSTNGTSNPRRTQSPFYRDGLAPPPTQFVFLQPSAFARHNDLPVAIFPDSDGAKDERPLVTTSHSKGDQLSIQRTHHEVQVSTLTLNTTLLRQDQLGVKSSVGTNWHELYDFPRTSELAPLSVPQKPQPKSVLQQDYRFLRHLEALGASCIPRLLVFHDSDTDLQRNILVTSALGPSLNELLLFCGNQLTLRTLSMLTIRLLDAMEEIHERDVVHGNITPTNIVMGADDQQSRVFLINFSQARFFRDPRTHRPNTTSTTAVNTTKKHNEFLSFCSTFVQRKCTAAPRDDIIALGYVLCYLYHGGLPWTREKTLNVAEVLRQKTAYMETLQRTPPIQLHYFLKSGYALRQNEIPDYRYLKSLVTRMMEEKKWSDGALYDWSSQLRLVRADDQQ